MGRERGGSDELQGGNKYYLNMKIVLNNKIMNINKFGSLKKEREKQKVPQNPCLLKLRHKALQLEEK